MGKFHSKVLDTRQNIPRDPDNPWPHTLLSELHYECSDGTVIKVAPGFTTDWASVPPAFQRVIPKDGEYDPAAVIHDLLMEGEFYPNKRCAEIFLEALVALGVAPWKRKAMYQAVLRFGAMTWKDHTPERIAQARHFGLVYRPQKAVKAHSQTVIS